MAKYKVTGLYTISFEMEVEADSIEEAEQMGYDVDIMTEWNGNSVFSDEAELNADGEPSDIEAELIDDEDENGTVKRKNKQQRKWFAFLKKTKKSFDLFNEMWYNNVGIIGIIRIEFADLSARRGNSIKK